MDAGHTRWHPDVLPVARIADGDIVVADVRDGSDGQIGPSTSDADRERYDVDRLHPLTGPFYVDRVEPGDLLEVEIIDIEPPRFAWTRLSSGGGGLMRDWVRESLLVKWHLENGVARSPDLPQVAIPAAPFVGTIGVAPSPEHLTQIIEREAVLRETGGWALAPSLKNAVPRTPEIQQAGLRTMPPREFGGNMDIKDVAVGSRVCFVAEVPGALLSFGDLHFAQGDGESFGTAIEMDGVVTFRCTTRKARDVSWAPRSPFIQTDRTTPARESRPCIITTGISVDDQGRNSYMDLNLAAQNALNEMTAYLANERGYTEAQAQVIVSVAGDLRINVVNNPPNPVVSVTLPLDIFELATPQT